MRRITRTPCQTWGAWHRAVRRDTAALRTHLEATRQQQRPRLRLAASPAAESSPGSAAGAQRQLRRAWSVLARSRECPRAQCCVRGARPSAWQVAGRRSTIGTRPGPGRPGPRDQGRGATSEPQRRSASARSPCGSVRASSTSTRPCKPCTASTCLGGRLSAHRSARRPQVDRWQSRCPRHQVWAASKRSRHDPSCGARHCRVP